MSQWYHEFEMHDGERWWNNSFELRQKCQSCIAVTRWFLVACKFQCYCWNYHLIVCLHFCSSYIQVCIWGHTTISVSSLLVVFFIHCENFSCSRGTLNDIRTNPSSFNDDEKNGLFSTPLVILNLFLVVDCSVSQCMNLCVFYCPLRISFNWQKMSVCRDAKCYWNSVFCYWNCTFVTEIFMKFWPKYWNLS